MALATRPHDSGAIPSRFLIRILIRIVQGHRLLVPSSGSAESTDRWAAFAHARSAALVLGGVGSVSCCMLEAHTDGLLSAKFGRTLGLARALERAARAHTPSRAPRLGLPGQGLEVGNSLSKCAGLAVIL